MRLLTPVITILAVLLLAILRAGTQSDDQARAEDPSIDKLASELKRVPPKDPDMSRGLVQLHKDFRIELVAGEPLIHDPAAIDFDENGRIFVAQLPEYNAYAAKDFKGQGSVHMLTDSNGDGRYDQADLFLDKIRLVDLKKLVTNPRPFATKQSP